MSMNVTLILNGKQVWFNIPDSVGDKLMAIGWLRGGR